MHRTLERIQADATPLVDGPVKVYFVLLSLLLTATSARFSSYVAAIVVFSLLTVHAVGRAYVTFLQYPIWFLLPSLVLIALVTPGTTTVFEYWILHISEEGLLLATKTGLRSIASLSVLSFLALTTTVPQLVSALRTLGLPDPLVEMLLLVYRGIQVLVDESIRLYTAAKLRGGFTSKRATFRTTKHVATSLLLSSLDSAEQLDLSMRSRCYDGVFPVRDYDSRGHTYALGALALLVFVRFVGTPSVFAQFGGIL
ncbi:cobalt ECF transporter T component CbiQ (plasmid) [Haloferax mediterranei ATCC 33500]|uniref:CbiQ protein ( ABC-type cobalt transport system permease protein 1) n=1 Tax=Haloferax mediterranei (strain ATCC 33500 / DSM 1411 / JCM 8866 / NBRC 14739 / NCIMB 2177 / R-4) TaxID=523841 RepID=I3R9J6_HALMT|nr:cobalt ECF transporter T component CbiQ [Haloferax mediterranei]AFK20906.1 CbiQ protein (ABC-type cobalt transport system permease protein 1) [Haloferax mediterranei ATCC 33500]AHZ24225.1 cobalt ABC transporter permease [Haloferax mediterranei ATCC 33500]EMA05304.1 CbiQ protein (ABC-type cobalt transport system permease protein 1) [Haloferax mediterranei ATCC 33500]MDX5989894.1 cobalt ECF transporter T component CbiQ [Haloferax mediterranei ATCC 33500]QCQ77335.1 cobalt ECF transporter T com